MKKTKIKILEAARTLFNEQGYSAVTIRMIAQVMNISSGNLNYHFKTREEILEALYFEMVSSFDERVASLKDDEISFKSIQEDMEESLKQMMKYRFIWTDLYNLLRLNAKIKSHFEKVYEERYQGFSYLISYLQNKTWMQHFGSKIEERLLIERMINLGNTGLYNSFLYKQELDTEEVRHQSNSLLFALFPYLTEEGKAVFMKEVDVWGE